MPTINIFHQKEEQREILSPLVRDFKKFVAEELTCNDIKLKPEEISVRCIRIDGGEMIGTVEVEVHAHSFRERIEKEDRICLDISRYFKEHAPSVGDVKTWLALSELGYSWE